ncbi:MAG TPA: thioesterase family protein [Sandaracinaceae bacterium]
MDGAFFTPDGDRFVASELVRGPWDPRFAHGGPPSALLAREAERLGKAHGTPHVARLTVDLLRPVPIAPLEVRSEVVRAGRSALVLALSLRTGDTELLRASALCMRLSELDVPAVGGARAIPPPEAAPPFELPFFPDLDGYHTAMELRIVEGEFGKGPTVGWLRMRVPLVAGEEPSGIVRVLCAADSGNGISPVLDWRKHTFVNPDLTVVLARPHRGEWVGMDASTWIDPRGVGLAQSVLHDGEGAFGHAAQTLLVAPR